ncbi:hypothetical protein BD779DRAFT_220435 [Infundibulicybe gibba]|nr:hypothetical protein BD779DRAFT_220435 [Infundibulicybe gibba]
MIASRLSFYLMLFFALAVAIATPISRPGGKRTDISDVEAVFNTLKTSTDSILPQINGLVSNGTVTGTTITPLVNDLTSALNSATSSLGTLQAVATPTSNEVATLIAGVVSDVATTLNGVQGIVPTLLETLGGVDLALSKVLAAVDGLLAGVLTLVANL